MNSYEAWVRGYATGLFLKSQEVDRDFDFQTELSNAISRFQSLNATQREALKNIGMNEIEKCKRIGPYRVRDEFFAETEQENEIGL